MFLQKILKTRDSRIHIFSQHISLKTELPAGVQLSHPLGFSSLSTESPLPKNPSFLEIGPLSLSGSGVKTKEVRSQETQTLFYPDVSYSWQSAELKAGLVALNGSLCPLFVSLRASRDKRGADSFFTYLQGMQYLHSHAHKFFICLNEGETNPDFIQELADFLLRERGLRQVWLKFPLLLQRKDYQAAVAATLKADFEGIVVADDERMSDGLKRSGSPHLVPACQMLEWAWQVHQGELPMLGCGGVHTGAHVFQMIIRGARAVSVRSAIALRGRNALLPMLEELQQELHIHGFSHMKDAIGFIY